MVRHDIIRKLETIMPGITCINEFDKSIMYFFRKLRYEKNIDTSRPDHYHYHL